MLVQRSSQLAQNSRQRGRLLTSSRPLLSRRRLLRPAISSRQGAVRGEEVEHHRAALALAHKRQQELEERLSHVAAMAGASAAPALATLQQQLASSQRDLGQAVGELRELEQHYLSARAELAESEVAKQQLEGVVQQLQAELRDLTTASNQQAAAAAAEQRELQRQLAAQQEELQRDRQVIESLQQQAAAARGELASQQAATSSLQAAAAELTQQLAATTAAKAAAEAHAEQLCQQLRDAEGEMSVLAHAHAETEQLAAQVAADLAAAREWANANAARFDEVQKQLGSYQSDLTATQEDLRATNARLEAAEAQHAAVGQELQVTKQRLQEEQAAHTSTVEDLSAARRQLECLKTQYLATRDALEQERSRRLELEGSVAELKQRLSNLAALRDRQMAAAAAERAQWEAQLAASQQQRDSVKQQLQALQQDYFGAYERLDAEQQRVASLESIVSKLEDRLSDLSSLAANAPAWSSLEVGGGPADLFVVSNALKTQVKDAQAALSTSRNLVAMLEMEYSSSRSAVDEEHQHYRSVEKSLEFLQEKLRAVEAAGAGETAEYERSTAELREQLETQASMLVACQLRIAALKDELAASKRRLEDEQSHEAALTQRALALQAEAQAAARQLGAAGAPMPQQQRQTDRASEQQQQQQHHEGLSDGELARLEAGELLKQLNLALEQSLPTMAAAAAVAAASADSPEAAAAAVTGLQPDEAAEGGPGGVDMGSVRRHVEGMAKQYVQRLSVAEEELRAVRSVWQQAEHELVALRKQQAVGSSSAGGGTPRGRRSPSLTDLVSLDVAISSTSSMEEEGPGPVGPSQQAELAQLAPLDHARRNAVSARHPHAAAEAEHGVPAVAQLVLELPSPVFGSDSAGDGQNGGAAGNGGGGRWGLQQAGPSGRPAAAAPNGNGNSAPASPRAQRV